MKKIMKNFLSLIVLSLIFVPMLSMAAGTLTTNQLGVDEIQSGIALGDKNPMETATTLINTAMIFLGLIAVAIVLLAGFKWMTAGGSDDKITEAKKLMSAGVVGLVILLSAWGIAKFVLDKLVTVTTT